MNKRRKLIVALGAGALGSPLVSLAQQPAAKVPRIGFLDATSLASSSARIEVFRDGLRKLGYFEGRNIAIDYRFAEGKSDRLNDLASELVRLNVDIIIAGAAPGAAAAKQSSRTIPVVFVGVADPVATGLVASLARPGGNITGLTSLAPALNGKRLEVLKESFPRVSRVAVLRNPSNPGDPLQWKETQTASQALGLRVQPLEARNLQELEAALEAATKWGAQGLLTLVDPLFRGHIKQIVDFAAKNRLPAIYPTSEYVEAGGLMSYAPDALEYYSRAATYVDKILKGAKAAELPVEQPTRFDLVLNLKTANAMGLKFPQSFLVRANKVIE